MSVSFDATESDAGNMRERRTLTAELVRSQHGFDDGWRSRLLRLAARGLRLIPKGRHQALHLVWKAVGSPSRYVGQLDGVPFVVDARDVRAAEHMFLWGCYEPAVTLVCIAILKPGNVVVDIGANKGYFSLLALNRVGARGQVVSFEPLPSNLLDLEDTRRLGGYANWIIQPTAAGDEAGSALFHLDGLSEGHSVFGRIDPAGSVTVQVDTIDAAIPRLGFDHIDVLKMDVEGHECKVVLGMRRHIAERRIRHVLCEVHMPCFSLEEFNQMRETFSSAGYRAFLIDEPRADIRRCLRGMATRGDMPVADLLRPLDEIIPLSHFHVLWSAPAC
jgi:FkbM family methyltransferase